MKPWILQKTDIYRRHGGKRSRKRTVERLIYACENIKQHDPKVKAPHMIGKKQVHEFYNRHSHLAPTTLRDYYYALAQLWQWLGREGKPPKR